MLTLVTAPTVEPVNHDEVREHLRLGGTAEGERLDRLIESARDDVETRTGRALMAQTWDLNLDCFPAGDRFELPKAPLLSVTSITYVDTAGATQTWSSSSYVVKVHAGAKCQPGTVSLAYLESYPTHRSIADAVTIRFVAGYLVTSGDDETDQAAVPAQLREAVLLSIQKSYEGDPAGDLERAIQRLCAPYSVKRW